jgi:uncharacterized protein YybS (DUF2232 family)
MQRAALRLGSAAAASTGLYGLAVSFPPLASPLFFVVPLPGLIVATRAPSSDCSFWFFLTTAAIGTALGLGAATGFIVAFGLPVLVMAVGIRRFWAFERVVVAGVATWALAVLGVLLRAHGGFEEIAGLARQHLAHSVDVALSTYASLGVSENTVAQMAADRDRLVTGLLETLPALVVLAGATIVVANLFVLRRWTDFGRQVNLRLWRAPEPLIWALIVAGFGMFVPAPAVALASRNLFILILAWYFCQGLAIVSYYLDRYRVPRSVRIASYVLITVQQLLAALVLALGVFDLWGDFRRVNTGPADIQFRVDGE